MVAGPLVAERLGGQALVVDTVLVHVNDCGNLLIFAWSLSPVFPFVGRTQVMSVGPISMDTMSAEVGWCPTEVGAGCSPPMACDSC